MKDMKMVSGKRFVVLGVIVFCVLVLGQSLIIQAQDDTIDSIIDEMTLEHKIGQMFMVNLFGQGLTDAGREILEVWQPGAVVILDSNIINAQQVTQLTNTYQTTIIEAGGVPLFITTDQDLKRLMADLIGGEKEAAYFYDLSLVHGFFYYFASEMLRTLESFEFTSSLSPRLGEAQEWPQEVIGEEPCFVIDVSIKLNGQAMWGKILLPDEFRRNRKSHFSTLPPPS